MKENITVPKLVIIGDSAYDTNRFIGEDGSHFFKTNYGGAGTYSSVPASLFYRVGLVSNAGEDFNVDKLKKFNIDLRGFHTRKDEKTSRFYNILKTRDGQEREIAAEYNERLTATFDDIPKEFLKAKYFYISTMLPKNQKQIIEKLRNHNPKVIIGVDTFEEYANSDETREVFDLADIAFVDKEFSNLIQCKSKTKVIKLGKTGCILLDREHAQKFDATVIENVVDKTGAGDCLNGVFMNLIANGYSNEVALKKAIEIATLSIKDFGILHIKDRIMTERDEAR